MSKRSIKRDKDYPIYQAGLREGRREMQALILTYLENRYMDRSVVRGSTLGKAILEVAADLGKYLRSINPATNKPTTDGKPAAGVESNGN